MATLVRVIVMIVRMALLGTGCFRREVEHVTKTVRSHPVLVEPNVEMAKARKRMTRAEVEAALGKPRKDDQITSFYKGVWVRFDTNGVVFNVKCVMGFEGVTKDALRHRRNVGENMMK